MGIPIDGAVEIFCDNKSVVDNCTIPGSALKKKHTSIAFHMAREAQAASICIVRHIPGTENPADILTKSLPSPVFWKHVWNFMTKHTNAENVHLEPEAGTDSPVTIVEENTTVRKN
jgi:hypothetical protein